MFGYACNETEEFMPYLIALAHELIKRLTDIRKDGISQYLRPDGKSQVTVEYNSNGNPVRLVAVGLSTQHDPEVAQKQIHDDIINMLDLRRPIYKKTAAYGHFGDNTSGMPWEQLDKVKVLKEYL